MYVARARALTEYISFRAREVTCLAALFVQQSLDKKLSVSDNNMATK